MTEKIQFMVNLPNTIENEEQLYKDTSKRKNPSHDNTR